MECTDVVLLRTPEDKGPNVPLHLLPCCIQHNGPAPVSAYFHPSSHGDGVQYQSCAFRGRHLLGSSLPLPAGYKGVIAEEIMTKEQKEGARLQGLQGDSACMTQWAEQQSFSTLSYWRHDSKPSDSDGPAKALGWLRLAAKIHKPLTAADLDGTP